MLIIVGRGSPCPVLQHPNSYLNPTLLSAGGCWLVDGGRGTETTVLLTLAQTLVGQRHRPTCIIFAYWRFFKTMWLRNASDAKHYEQDRNCMAQYLAQVLQ